MWSTWSCPSLQLLCRPGLSVFFLFFLFFGFSFVVLLFCVVLIDYPVRRDYVTDVSSFLSCLAVVLCILEPLCLFALSCLAVMFLWSLNSCFIYWCSCFSDFFF